MFDGVRLIRYASGLMKKTSSFMLKVLRVGEPQRAMRVNTPQRAAKYWSSVVKNQSWFDTNKEHLVVLILSAKYNIQGYSLVSIGSLNESIAHPREIFRAAVAAGAYGIILMHNHPSGDPTPSTSDRGLIERTNEAGELLAIQVLDHIIIGKNRSYFSWRDEADAIAEKNRRRRKLRKRHSKGLKTSAT